ncbi:ribonuclease H-like domain-containing protein [Tanacetum coccineum]
MPTPTQSPTTQTEPVAQSPIIILDLPKHLNRVSVHPMVTHFCVRTNRPTEHLNLYVSSVSPLPKSYRDVFSDLNWQNAMCDEYHALIKNKSWTLVPRPPDTNIVRFKGVDVDETFSLVVKPGTIQTVLIYMHQPTGFRDFVHPDYMRLLQRSDTTYLLLYVDDIVLTDSSEHQLLTQWEFAMTYLVEILERADMVNCNLSRTPEDTESKLGNTGNVVSDPTLYRSFAGSLQYLTFTRPDISYAVDAVIVGLLHEVLQLPRQRT